MVEWAYTHSGLLQGQVGQALMGSPGLPVSARIHHSIYCLGRLVISPGQCWHRASLPHPAAGNDFYTRSFFPVVLSPIFISVMR